MNITVDIKGYRYEERPNGRALLWAKISVNGWKPQWSHIISAGGPEDELTVLELRQAAGTLKPKAEGLDG